MIIIVIVIIIIIINTLDVLKESWPTLRELL